MKREQIQKLLSENEDINVFDFDGKCHDCNTEMCVSVVRVHDYSGAIYREDVDIIGGAIYQPENAGWKQFLKCESCFVKDPILRNYREIDTYSRVSGYLSPSRQYNAGKLAEFKARKMFRMATMPETTPEGLHTPCQCPAQT